MAMYQHAQRSVADRRSAVNEAQRQVSTGMRINKVSDDVSAARRSLRAESLLRDVESNRQTLNHGEHLLGVADAALGDVSNLVQRVAEMSVQFANDTYNTQDRLQAADELTQIRARLLELSNTQDDGRYVFGGLGGAQPPYDATGAFVGDTEQLELVVGRGARVEATLSGGVPFVAGPSSTTGPTMFQTIDALETALRADNGAAVGALVDEIRGHEDRIRQARQVIGHRFERIEHVRQALDQVELTASQTLETDRDADLTDSIIQLRQAEAGLQGALMVTARLDALNLMNFL